jgi:hypothetical protein
VFLPFCSHRIRWVHIERIPCQGIVVDRYISFSELIAREDDPRSILDARWMKTAGWSGALEIIGKNIY